MIQEKTVLKFIQYALLAFKYNYDFMVFSKFVVKTYGLKYEITVFKTWLK